MLRVLTAAALASLACLSGACAQEQQSAFSFTPATGWAPPDSFTFHPPNDPSNWRVGAFAGKFNAAPESVLFVAPFLGYRKFSPAYVGGLNAVWTVLSVPKIPLEIELDLSATSHFGGQNYYEGAVVPSLRWTWFPWNNLVYTNFRFGVLGPSFTTIDSQLEAYNTLNNYTRRWLSGGLFEWTFAPAATSSWEAFMRIHHRSGVFGLIDGVYGGSNYVSFGARFKL